MKRFGVSLEDNLLKDLDEIVNKQKLPNRSQAIRYLIRKNQVDDRWEANQEVSGCIVLVYDHHKRELVDKLMDIQHDFQKAIVSTQHIHLDHDNCLEIIAVCGNSSAIKKLADMLKAMNGVNHSTLSVTAA